MITAAASSSCPNKGKANGEAKQHPELLMAARQGNSEVLDKLLNNQDGVVIDINNDASGNEDALEAAPASALDSVIHVVASSGDGDVFLKSADVIYAKAKHLLDARNGNGDTPLQCATRAGNARMVSHLMDLAKSGGDSGVGAARLKEMLRNQNERGETALHDALRLADKNKVREMVRTLLQLGDEDGADDAELASLESKNGTSPLYLAVMLGQHDIAETLYTRATVKEGQRHLSYSGPHGQNALHAAVLRSYGLTEKLLKWNKGLTKQRDKTTGSTPLHMAATWEEGDKRVIKLLLKTDKSSAFLSDNKGSFPIHAAAARTYFPVARLILNECPGCAGLQDNQGKTFLHIAVEKERPLVVGFVCWQSMYSSILNIRDNDGNTALHLAAEVGNHISFYSLIQNPRVQLDLVNNEGKTPMDTAEKMKPEGIVFALNPRLRIYLLLKGAGAKNGIFRWDWLSEDHADKKTVFYEDYERRIVESTQVIGIGSVLIITVAFASAFTLPGAFINADHYSQKGPCTLHGGQEYCAGKATLAYDNAFRVFIVANTLALVCSALATMAVMFAGVATVDIRTRMFGFLISVFFLYCSAKSLAAAFLCGLFAMLPRDALMLAYISGAIGAPFLILDVLWYISMSAIGEMMLLKRLGWTRWFRSSHLERTCIADLFRVFVMPLPRKKDDHPRKKTAANR